LTTTANAGSGECRDGLCDEWSGLKNGLPAVLMIASSADREKGMMKRFSFPTMTLHRSDT
jgi:hypothetical protein